MSNLMQMYKNQYTDMQSQMHSLASSQKLDVCMPQQPQIATQTPQSDNLLSTLYNQNLLYLKLMENIEKNTYINNFYQQFNQQLIQQNNSHNSIMHSLLTGFVLQNSLISTQILLNLCNNDTKKDQNVNEELQNSKIINLEAPIIHNNNEIAQQSSQQQLQSNLSMQQQEENKNNTPQQSQQQNDQDYNDENIMDDFTDISISSIDLDELQIYAELDLENIFNQQKGLSKKEIKKIPSYIYQGKKKGFQLLEDFYGINKKSKKIQKNHLHCQEKNVNSTTNLTCCICLSEYRKGSKVRKLSCGHKFHCSCIDRWLQKKTKCPYCKKEAISTVTTTSSSQ